MLDFTKLINDNTRSDDYVHANKWCEAYGVKWRDFRQSRVVRKYIKTLQDNGLDVVTSEGRGEKAKSWIHPLLAIKLAEWLNPEFEMFVKQTFVRYLKADITLADDIIQRQTDPEKIAWIRERAEGKGARIVFTQALQASGTSRIGFALNTNAIYESLFGMSAKELKIEYNTANPRDELGLVDLTAIRLSELLAAEKIEKEQAKGNSQTVICSKIASLAVKGAIDLARM